MGILAPISSFDVRSRAAWMSRNSRCLTRRRMLFESLERRVVLAATVPVNESFEVANLAELSAWTFTSREGGTVSLDKASAPINGTTTIRFDSVQGSASVVSEAVLELDLSGVSNATDLGFNFWMKRLNSSPNPHPNYGFLHCS